MVRQGELTERHPYRIGHCLNQRKTSPKTGLSICIYILSCMKLFERELDVIECSDDEFTLN